MRKQQYGSVTDALPPPTPPNSCLLTALTTVKRTAVVISIQDQFMCVTFQSLIGYEKAMLITLCVLKLALSVTINEAKFKKKKKG